MTTTNERITHLPQDRDAWVCICGNTPRGEGFYACDENGSEIHALIESGWQGHYVCDRCHRIIRGETLEVVGRKPDPKRLAG